MALQKPFTTDHGISLPAAYFRVERPVLVTKTKLDFEVCGYANSSAADGAAPVFVQGYSCQYDLDGTNPLKQAYTHLKGLPEFTSAEDV